jgi:hypothetical protein
MKTPLAERPIFHQREPRIDSHIFLCVIAFHVLAAIEKTKLDRARPHLLGERAKHAQNPPGLHYRLPTKGGRCLRIPKAATPGANAKDLYRRVAIAPDVMRPIHTW